MLQTPRAQANPRAAFTCPSSQSSSFCHQLSDNVTWDLPKGLSWSFSWSSSGELLQPAASSAAVGVRELGLLKPWVQVWGVPCHPSSPGSFHFAARAMAEGAEPRGDVVLYLSITAAPGKAALVPWKLAVTLAQFSGLSLWTLTKGRKAAAMAQRMKC